MKVDELAAAHGQMVQIRLLEERISTLYAGGAIPRFVHTSPGQEACAAGALVHARGSDVITSTRRGRGHVAAKGLEPRRPLAEVIGKQAGACHGPGGSMHVADPSIGIVGAGLPIVAGAAHALRGRDCGDVVVCFFGDGAVATGAFHESLNLAALWGLPIVFFCEDNGFSEFSQTEAQHPVPVISRASAYGMNALELPGSDVEAVADGMRSVLEGIRGSSGPVLVVARTLRVHGHYEGDPQRYRDATTMAIEIAATDPISLTRGALLDRGAAQQRLDEIEQPALVIVDEAEQFATAAATPAASSVLDYVYASRPAAAAAAAAAAPLAQDRPLLAQSRIIRQAMDDALEADPTVFLAGIDVVGGNIFGVTRGLAESYPGRVLDTPIAETAIMGLGVGAAVAGLRPVVELMYLDFLGVCLDQLMNQAAKPRLLTGGAVTVPLVVRTQFGSGRSSGSQHSQSLEAFARTDRMVIAQEAVTDFGVGAEIAALAVSAGFWSLDAPVLRVGAPYATVLEREWEAGQTEIVAAVHEGMAC